jgi:hypothetical protein
MGIYYSNKIYGIWCDYFSYKYANSLTEENILEIKAAYDALTDQQRAATAFYAYVEAESTYGETPFLTNVPITDKIDAWLKKMTPSATTST